MFVRFSLQVVRSCPVRGMVQTCLLLSQFHIAVRVSHCVYHNVETSEQKPVCVTCVEARDVETSNVNIWWVAQCCLNSQSVSGQSYSW